MHSHLGESVASRPISALWKFLVCLILGLGCQAGKAQAPNPSTSSPRLNVVVTIPPLVGIVKPLLPEGSELKLLMPPGRSEHGYEFTPSDLAAVAKADVLIYVGLGLEPRIEKEVKERPIASRAVICMSEALGIVVPPHETPEHDEAHEDGHDHHHGIVDQHLWLDPKLVESLVPKLAEAIKAAMERHGVGAEGRSRVDDAAAKLVKDVKGVDAMYCEKLAPLKGAAIVTHHNAFKRLADRYGLVIAESIREFDNSDPTPKEIEEIVRTIRAKNVGAIFIEPNYNPKIAERIARATGVKIGKLDPLGDGDWFKMMRTNLDQLVLNLKQESK